MNQIDIDNKYMGLAIAEAQKASAEGEIPVGCIVVAGGRIVGRGHNLTETLSDVTAHAEMQAITAAAAERGAKYLDDSTIYITLEPCLMCAGAIGWSQLKRIVIGARDPQRGFSSVTSKSPFHPRAEVIWDIRADECRELVLNFFRARRNG